MSYNYDKYLRVNKLPHIWCPGCGYGIAMKALIRAIDTLGWDQNETVIASGIGCVSRMPGYMDFNTIHTTHGRSLAFATGIKLANPKLKVIVLGGDGDMSAIGGNHLIHACRRNIDLSLLVFNNQTYGMTGGQYSPTTPLGKMAATAPYGMIENSFDISKLAIGSGASMVARTSSYHVAQMEKLMIETLQHKGLSMLEVVTGCHTGYGRRNKMPEAIDMLELQKNNAVMIDKANKMTPEELAQMEAEGKFTIGLLHKVEGRPEYVESYDKAVGIVK